MSKRIVLYRRSPYFVGTKLLYQSAKLTVGPMPEASRFDAGPVETSHPLAPLASENLTTENCEQLEIHFSLSVLKVSGHFLSILAP